MPRRKQKRLTYAAENPLQTRKFLEAAKRRGVDADSRAFRQAKRALRGAKPRS